MKRLEKEQKILNLVVSGLDNKAISKKLRVGTDMVKKTKGKVYMQKFLKQQ